MAANSLVTRTVLPNEICNMPGYMEIFTFLFIAKMYSKGWGRKGGGGILRAIASMKFVKFQI